MNSKTLLEGTLIKAISGFYYVSFNNEVYECKARGNFRLAKVSPIVGDRVQFTPLSHNKGIIDNVLPRKNCLSRPVVANIDKIIIVSSFINPAPDTYLIDRLSAVSVFNGIEPVIVFNKADTGDFSAFENIYKNAGFRTYVVSAKNAETLNNLKNEFCNCVCAMAGNTGVGKSSLINALFSDLCLKIGEISIALGRGKHTTRHTELFKTELGGYVIDTPGFSSIDELSHRYEFKLKLPECFPDFSPYTRDCRFSDCTHTTEKDCGVLSAVSIGKIEKTRHNSYVQLYNELKDATNWRK